jgi:FkbM family methyltransferase
MTMLPHILLEAAKWLVPHGIARRGARRVVADETEKQFEALRKLYQPLVPPGSLVFDIGANVGNRVEPLLRCGARVIAVEPQPDCVALLKRRFADRITTLQCAVGSQAGEMDLHLSSDHDTLATLSPEFMANSQASGRHGGRRWSAKIRVKVETLDSLIDRYGVPSFVKIDVEGFDFEVLKGLSKPLDALSFEWTSDMPESATRCIDRAVQLGMPYFQFSFGEGAVFSHRTAVDAATARQLVSLLGEDPRLFGDIFALRIRLRRP